MVVKKSTNKNPFLFLHVITIKKFFFLYLKMLTFPKLTVV